MWQSWKIRTGAGLAAAVAAVVVAGTIATLAMGGGTTPKPSAHGSATATPLGRPIAATCLRTAPNCNDTKFGSGGDTELTCEEAQACGTMVEPPNACAFKTAGDGAACGPAVACPMLPPRPMSAPVQQGNTASSCRVCAGPPVQSSAATATTQPCAPPCVLPLPAQPTTPSNNPPTSLAPDSAACPIECDPLPCGGGSCGLPIQPKTPIAGEPAQPVVPACPMPAPPCTMPLLPNGPEGEAPDVAPACPPPPICTAPEPPTGTGSVEPQSAPVCVAPGCAISSDGVISCPTPGVIGGSAGSSGSGPSGSGIAEPGMPVQITPAPWSAP